MHYSKLRASIWQFIIAGQKSQHLKLGSHNFSLYTIDNVQLNLCDSVKDLGVYISADLKPSEHIGERPLLLAGA